MKVLGPDGSESCLVFHFLSLGPVHFSDPAFTWACSLYSITENSQPVGKLSFLHYCDILQGHLLVSLRSFNNIQAICSLTAAFYTLGSILEIKKIFLGPKNQSTNRHPLSSGTFHEDKHI